MLLQLQQGKNEKKREKKEKENKQTTNSIEKGEEERFLILNFFNLKIGLLPCGNALCNWAMHVTFTLLQWLSSSWSVNGNRTISKRNWEKIMTSKMQ